MSKTIEKKKESGFYPVWNNTVFLFRHIAIESPFLFVLIVVEIIGSVTAPIIGIYLPSLAVELVTDRANITVVLLKLGGLGIALAFIRGVTSMASDGKYLLYNGMRWYFQKKIFFKSLHCDYIYVESKEGMTMYQKAMNTLLSGDWSGTSRMLVSSMGLMVSVLSFVVYSGILTGLHPFVVVGLVLISVLNLVVYRYAQDYEHNQRDNMTELNQKLNYVEYTAKNSSYGKDIRLYGIADWFIELREELTIAYRNLQNRVRKRFFYANGVEIFTRVLQDGLAYGYLIYCVIKRQITIDEFVLYFGAITGFSGFVSSITEHFNQLRSANLQMNDMRKYFDRMEGEEENYKTPDIAKTSEVSGIQKSSIDFKNSENLSIDFEHVWFSYNKDESYVLKDFCVHINAGEKMALVGVNGAGKTTIVKLMCGFYKPDQGVIRINGVNVSDYRKEELYQLFSAVFQDLYMDPFTVAENISMATENETDMERVEMCLEKTGLLEIIRSYPGHIHSYMNRNVYEGIELSGGQQQKLLMARALYKDAPVMILDEPTAALDPIAESETYENFHALTGQKTVIYISHRLASTRFCDRIVFLKDGRNAECGSHEELMKQDGEYAQMYEVQSHYYQKEENVNEDKENLE